MVQAFSIPELHRVLGDSVRDLAKTAEGMPSSDYEE